MFIELNPWQLDNVGLEPCSAFEPTVSAGDRRILRDLARRVAEIVSLPVMAQRRAMWTKHNGLERVRPMVLVFPEGSWRELLPASMIRSEGNRARAYEWALRHAIYHHEHLHDDTVIEPKWVVRKQIYLSGWGLEPRQIASSDPNGAWGFDPVILQPDDLDKLHTPTVTYDEQATAHELGLAEELFGDILGTELRGVGMISFHLMNHYTALRGLEQVMIDMLEAPDMLHRAMSILEDGNREIVRQYQRMGLLTLNNDGEYHASGGVTYSDELPGGGQIADRIRLSDLWASAEAQEMAQVSPRMHAEFILPYEKRLLEPFGLNGYGCCEDLGDKLPDVLTIPNLRRVSISPFADVRRCAEQLGDRCIFSWKPLPVHLVGRFDAAMIRDYLTHTCEVTRDGVVEIILKDTHTCQNHPERFTQWTDIAQEVVAQF